jgi:isoquinoline 1-oxidoreductase subunit beta
MTRPGLDRRKFVQLTGVAGAGLVVGFTLPPTRDAVARAILPVDSFRPNGWIRLGTDGTVTLMVDEMEMGQGVITAVPMILAEELEIPWSAVKVVYGPKDPSSWERNISTGGSTSVRTSWEPLRKAGAQAREMLVAAGAQELGVPNSECHADQGDVVHGGSGRRMAYGELVELASTLPVPAEPTLKSPDDFKIVGTSIKRQDTPEKTDGSKKYALDVQLDGMLVAVIERSPVFGGTLRSFDSTDAVAVAGVRNVFAVDAGVAVVASNTWAAMEGRRALKDVQWDEGAVAAVSTESVERDLINLTNAEGAIARNDGDAVVALATGQRVDALYEVPFLAHATMEPMNTTAHVTATSAEVWSPTQAATAVQRTTAQITGLDPSAITVHSIPMGGGFGRRSNTDFAAEAVQVSAHLKLPVKVMWTREDDTRGGYYRPAAAHRFAATLDAEGMPSAWRHRVASTSLFLQFGPRALDRSDGVDGDGVAGARQLAYGIPNLRVEYAPLSPGIPLHWWRSVGHSHNGFVTESFIDELAYAAGMDPFAYRRQLLADEPRSLGVLERAAAESGWGDALPEGHARGIAAHASFGSFVAQVAEVSIEDGGVRVHRVTCAVDCGQTINPDTIRAQMESSIVYGLTAALRGQIRIDGGRAVEGNFDTYPMLRINQMPAVDTHIIESREDPGGIGEAGLPPLAPAVTNAIFALTSQRIRKLPIADQLTSP